MVHSTTLLCSKLAFVLELSHHQVTLPKTCAAFLQVHTKDPGDDQNGKNVPRPSSVVQEPCDLLRHCKILPLKLSLVDDHDLGSEGGSNEQKQEVQPGRQMEHKAHKPRIMTKFKKRR